MCTEGKIDKGGRDFTPDHRRLTIIRILYETLEHLIAARYSREKLSLLEKVNLNLEMMRYQTRLLRDFKLMDYRRYGHVSGMINKIGRSLGGWLYQQRGLNQ
jgi:hypothetical protein